MAAPIRDAYVDLPRFPLKICASLVNHPANLGALCRTVEVFRLESLVMADGAIARSSAFRGLAASSHHWQPLEICPVPDLPDWLMAQQTAGYCPIALDLSDRAVPLTNFSFPQRSVLVLGQELTGIPAHLQLCCQQVVMIPQFGLVQSLNVQTAGAIAIYEYIRQHGTVGGFPS
jgi:tRNA G18 (ribose-2'-O)-methylase SpoU